MKINLKFNGNFQKFENVTILLKKKLIYSNSFNKTFVSQHRYTMFTLTGCNTTPSIPSENSLGNTFFII